MSPTKKMTCKEPSLCMSQLSEGELSFRWAEPRLLVDGGASNLRMRRRGLGARLQLSLAAARAEADPCEHWESNMGLCLAFIEVWCPFQVGFTAKDVLGTKRRLQTNMAVVVKTNGDPISGIGCRTYFSADWDVHWGYGILTHGHMGLCLVL